MELLGCVVRREVREFVFLELSPYALVRVEFEAVRWKAFDGQSRMLGFEGADEGPFVLACAVPEKHDVSLDVPQKRSEELGDVLGLETLLDLDVEEQFLGRADNAYEADLVPLPEVMVEVRCAATRSPGLTHQGRQAGA